MATEATPSATEAELQQAMADPRFVRGEALLKSKRLEEAVVVFEELLRSRCEVEQLGDALGTAPVYYAYGHALVSLAEATASVFGSGVTEEPSEGTEAEQDAKNTADDLEAAWEMLELARVIYSRFPGELAVETQLARVYMRLGDLGMESDTFEQARSDYEKALLLRQKVLKETQDPDTTLLADLYCCLAISCIYRDSTAKPAEDGADEEGAPEEKGDDEGLKYYVLAGRVMAENVHRLTTTCSTEVQQFVASRIPKYSASELDEAPKGKGKRKAGSDSDATRSLLFLGESMDTLKDEFVKAAGKAESELTKDEAQLLEYMEIYIELKEKVDGIKESAAAQPVEQPKAEASETKDSEAVTTIGFGAPAADTAGAPAVNVVPVVKKRKTTPTSSAAAADDAK